MLESLKDSGSKKENKFGVTITGNKAQKNGKISRWKQIVAYESIKGIRKKDTHISLELSDLSLVQVRLNHEAVGFALLARS